MAHDSRYRVDTARLIAILTGGKDRLPSDMAQECYMSLPHYEGGRWSWERFGLNFIPGPKQDLYPLSGGPYRIVIRPSSVAMATTPFGYKRRANMSHRILAECACGKLIPSGRLHQHASACSKLTGG